jgi:arylsulfatase B
MRMSAHGVERACHVGSIAWTMSWGLIPIRMNAGKSRLGRLARQGKWLFGVAVCVATLFSAVSRADSPNGKPNIVILLADDLGWNDVGYHGSTVKTPNLDRFVRDGIELDRFYVAPYCVPTRAGLMTGRYPHRFGLRYESNFAVRATLPGEARTLAEVLSDAGYSNRACIGKWHLGDSPEQHPLSQGFTHFYGMLGGMVHYFDHRTIPFGPRAESRPRVLDWHRDHDVCHDEGYSTDLIGSEAVRFIDANSSVQPFFLYVSFNSPHLPLHAKPELLDQPTVETDDVALLTADTSTNRALLSAMVASLDENLGRILEAIAQHGMRERTLILFLSDNGGYDRFGISDNSPLRGGKNTLWEGGVRVPAAVRWPAAWPGGRKVTEPLAYIDLHPMLARIAGVESLPDALDGKDIRDVLSGGRSSLQREVYLGPQTLVETRWKLVADQLFDLATDPGEMKDIARDHPDVVQRLQRKLAWLE